MTIEQLEASILSSIIFYYPNVSNTYHIEDLSPDIFIGHEAKKIFTAITLTETKFNNYDLVLISNALKSICNEHEYDLCFNVLDNLKANIQYFSFQEHLDLLQAHSTKLRLNQLCQTIITSHVDRDFYESLESWERDFMGISKQIDNNHYVTGTELVDEYNQIIQNSDQSEEFLKSGYFHLDKKIKGLLGGQFIVVAARPGVGKTTFVLNIVWNNLDKLQDDISIGIFSLEMVNISLLEKIIAIDTDVPLNLLRSVCDGYQLPDFDQQLVDESKHKIQNSNLLFFKDTYATIDKISSVIKTWKRKHNLKLVVIDYLQLISSPNTKDNNLNQTNKIGIISRKLKLLSIDLDICIIALSQLNRKLEDRKSSNKSPILSDIRESGSIEQDADVVMFLYENEKKDEEKEELKENLGDNSEVFLKVGKNRHGSIGKVNFQFNKTTGKFKEVINN